tara:strand:+ start:18792 stop:19610 length:819 start_codon:yes stop_codon:yes gene_type:complete
MHSNINTILHDPYLKDKLIELIEICILRAKDKDRLEVERKNDGTLITRVDKDINNLINIKLSTLFPSIPIISEEGYISKELFMQDYYWLIDPIDGTSSFVNGKDSYSVNIALIHQGNAVLGIIAKPATNTIWFGYRKKAFVIKKNKIKSIKTNTFNKDDLKLISSNENDYKTNKLIKYFKKAKLERLSSSIKFCKIAEGKANLYPRLSSISKWDIAAGDAIVRAANGVVYDLKGKDLNYKSPTAKTGEFFVLSSKNIWNSYVVEALKSINYI